MEDYEGLNFILILIRFPTLQDRVLARVESFKKKKDIFIMHWLCILKHKINLIKIIVIEISLVKLSRFYSNNYY